MSVVPVSTKKVANLAACDFLSVTYGWTTERAARVLASSFFSQPGGAVEFTGNGYVLVTRRGEDYLIEDHTGRSIS